ncbi:MULTISPECIES: patatin-like phospholipase RssA [Shewanella]|uniref:Patatin-like phospholipase RssA n=1 Tax=Shewanella oncorhynchi TaxID=2726434 RepID=A0AA50Q263_9GAMM|nr:MULTISPECIES: patatin-like phospholipase RssA [Shewanella]MBW3533361.1 patatin-like phospholipase RssA [Shewanella sp. NKUCC06_TVS]MCU8021251.1 patatin-like phospholipase RssA [Shewanella sp. SM78]MCU8028242.1 patatin-like phospholipase RssA [Shewanella sp. SM73]MCU8042810.1 patatin-like phospholipase RssA [Shewanella sp. SM68]MCU8047184.1 patatin-like phospholipase RssA [Shewanella sp. SM65]
MANGTTPSVGIALGSGAAKGWAHIGVLNGLAAMGIKPDKVAGCSVGALVGAAYAHDHLPELEKWVRGFSSWDVLGLMDIRWRKGGLIGGDKVFDVLHARIGDVNIENLNRPFAAVATDLYSGQEIWFTEGDLRQAVRASCSMPGILAPVRQGDRWLVDGAVVNPVPVSVSRAMGVDVVIAVDLYGYHSGRIQVLPVNMTSQRTVQAEMDMPARQETGFMDLFARGRDYVSNLTDKFSLGTKSNPGMIAVMSQSMGILEQRHKRARLMGDPPDICIVPEVGNIGTMEFHRADEAIAAGEAAVEKVAHLIEAALWKG